MRTCLSCICEISICARKKEAKEPKGDLLTVNLSIPLSSQNNEIMRQLVSISLLCHGFAYLGVPPILSDAAPSHLLAYPKAQSSLLVPVIPIPTR